MTSLSGLVVLLVEDDVDSRDFVELYLQGEGCRVEVAGSAEEARAAIRARVPDLMLADINLPDEDGFSLVRGLRADASTSALPAIAITGHAGAESRRAALDAGFQRVIVKPIDPFALRAHIEAALGQKGVA